MISFFRWVLFFRTAHERSHKAMDEKMKEKFRWPWKKVTSTSLNMEADDDDVIMLGNNEQNLNDAVMPTSDT